MAIMHPCMCVCAKLFLGLRYITREQSGLLAVLAKFCVQSLYMALGMELHSCRNKTGPAAALHDMYQQAGLSQCVPHAANGTDAVYFMSGIALGAFRTPGASQQACSLLCSPAR